MSVGSLFAVGVLAVVAIFAAYRLITSRESVYAALYLVLNFVATAGIYLALIAPFIAIVEIAVYAGAILILFLFIIWYLQPAPGADRGDVRCRRAVALAVAVALGALIVVGATTIGLSHAPAVAQLPYRVEDIGVLLFSRYALPFELASLLLLVAMVGVVSITRPLLAADETLGEGDPATPTEPTPPAPTVSAPAGESHEQEARP